ncbi:Diaminobutyrate--2-oxoglutarate aminotransferase [Vibrio aquimaris]|uniref:Diaminobutyrate--2-oxoglutarate aminotransferase n=1 Tax=Vibrio aquimaris TaxID=2587862 RepID=A0A5P9CP57_9VIBR|nr:diaminobutyrate--2-oxoglutarate aminotransferase [Vibrio aquimaris]
MKVFESLESEVRSYIRSFPAVFDTADNASYLK